MWTYNASLNFIFIRQDQNYYIRLKKHFFANSVRDEKLKLRIPILHFTRVLITLLWLWSCNKQGLMIGSYNHVFGLIFILAIKKKSFHVPWIFEGAKICITIFQFTCEKPESREILCPIFYFSFSCTSSGVATARPTN